MIVIRRLVDRRRAYTGIFLKGEPPRIFPTSDQEHARILAVFKQDRAYRDVQNDFADYALGKETLPFPIGPNRPDGQVDQAPLAPPPEEIEPAAKGPRRDENDPSPWLTLWVGKP